MAWDNGGRNLKLDQAKFIDRATLSRESAFNIAARGIRKNCNKFFTIRRKSAKKFIERFYI